ncbi:MAG: hypothetical protein Q8876_09250, partial [Bacillota bacterium]|nr:hypothetical protein [Bacillota bacterium]
MGNCIKEQKNIFKPDKWFGLLIFVTVAAVIIRILFYNHISLDYKACLLPWAKEISRYGGFPSLGHSIGNYNVPYMVFMSMFYYLPGEYLYWLKSFSVIFDFLLAFGAAKIVYLITEDPSKKRIKAIITFSAVIMLPTVLINSAFWGQCDSIYAALAVFSLYFLQKDKLLASSVFFGLSFCFKLQAVFILPVFILVYFSKIRNNQWAKNKIIKFLIIPLIFLIVDLPAIIAGRSIQDVLAIYINQSNQYNVLSYNYSNILFYFNYMPAYMYSFFKYGFLFFTFCIFA